MTQDLSRAVVRRTVQGRPTNNRDGLIPSRNITETAARQINADLRSAQRGSGGAEQLRQIFGLVGNAASSFQSYANARHVVNEQQAETQALEDQLAGVMDPEQASKSHAYNVAFSTGETMRKWGEVRASTEDAIVAALNDPSHPASLEDINGLIDQSFLSLITEDGTLNGKRLDHGSAEAERSLYDAMLSAKPQLIEKAREAIKAQVENRSISTAASNYREGAIRGDVTFEQGFAQIVPGTDLKKAKAALIDAGQEAALSLIDTDPDQALSIIDGMLTSKRADGTNSLDADELEQARNMRRRLTADAETAKATKQRADREAVADHFYDRLMGIPGSGAYPTAKEIQQARAEGKLEAEGARTLLNWIESDVREAEADRQARQRAAGVSISGHAPAGSSLVAMVYEGRMSPLAAKQEVLRRAAMGEFGSDKDRKKAVAGLLSELNGIEGVRKDGFDQASAAFKGEIAVMRRDVRRLSGPRRTNAEKWLKIVEDAGVVSIGSKLRSPTNAPDAVGQAVSRQVAKDFLSAFPELAR